MAKKPPEKPRDSVADTVDRLLKKLPGADPMLRGDEEEVKRARLSSAKFIDLDATVDAPVDEPREPTRRDKMFVWLRLTLAVAIGAAITQWPYVRECGAPLFGFALALTVVPLAGAWVSVSAWKWRLPWVHALGFGVVLWGAALWADLVLPRTGYAQTTAGWRCVAPPPPPLVDRTAAVAQPDGTVLFTREIGSTTPSIIVTSGGVVDKTPLRELGEQAHVVFYDPRHLGRSRASGASRGLQTDVEDLEAVRWSFLVRDALLMDTLYMVGWSYMGSIVAQYAIEHPDRVSGIVLLGSIGPTRAGHAFDWTRGAGQDTLGLELIRITQARGDDFADPFAFCRLVWDVSILHPRMSDPAAARDANVDVCRVRTPQYLRWEADHDRAIESLGNWDFSTSAGRYAGPVLVIHGSADPTSIESAQGWIRAFPNARFLEVGGAGNLPWLEQPAIVMQAIRSFVAGRWPAEAVRLPDTP